MQSLLRALGPDSVGQTVTLGLRRAGETQQIPADDCREAWRLSEQDAPDPIRLTLDIADAALADRLAALLADVPGLRLVGPGEAADAAVVLPAARRLCGWRHPTDTARTRGSRAARRGGASNKEIARRLGISVHTAKFHVGSLLDKLDAVGRTDAVAHAARLGVINL